MNSQKSARGQFDRILSVGLPLKAMADWQQGLRREDLDLDTAWGMVKTSYIQPGSLFIRNYIDSPYKPPGIQSFDQNSPGASCFLGCRKPRPASVPGGQTDTAHASMILNLETGVYRI